VLDGVVRAGVDEAELELLAAGGRVQKVAAAQLGFAKAAGEPGATTVSATLAVAASAGIRVAATGGIGGVLRGRPFDISADLCELARRNVALVSAGPKAIMDAERTYELLETLGIPVLGFRCKQLPLFFTADSGLPCLWRSDNVPALARAVQQSLATLPERGVLVVQAPPEEYALESSELQKLAETALNDATARSVTGPELTPFLLERLRELSAGRTLLLNQQLAVRNAELAADLALALVSLTQT
jgi:pseudouridine-5'-phosphate glycosidase